MLPAFGSMVVGRYQNDSSFLISSVKTQQIPPILYAKPKKQNIGTFGDRFRNLERFGVRVQIKQGISLTLTSHFRLADAYLMYALNVRQLGGAGGNAQF
jgi:hypothetical protein